MTFARGRLEGCIVPCQTCFRQTPDSLSGLIRRAIPAKRVPRLLAANQLVSNGNRPRSPPQVWGRCYLVRAKHHAATADRRRRPWLAFVLSTDIHSSFLDFLLDTTSLFLFCLFIPSFFLRLQPPVFPSPASSQHISSIHSRWHQELSLSAVAVSRILLLLSPRRLGNPPGLDHMPLATSLILHSMPLSPTRKAQTGAITNRAS